MGADYRRCRNGGVVVAATWIACFSVLVASAQQAPQVPANAPTIPSALPPEELLKLFPDAPGKDVTFRVCTTCHPPEKIATKNQTREEWEQTITAMTVRGARVSDDDYPVILDYLATTLPLIVNVNTATVEEFEAGLGLKHADAVALVTYRDQNGTFQSLDDIKKVSGIEFKRIQLKKNALRY